MKRYGLLVATAVASVGFAGCGGGDSNKTLSYSGFATAANKVCKTEGAKIDAASADLTGEAKADAPLYDKLIPALEEATDKFKALKPPSKLKADFDKFVSLSEQQIDGAKEAQTAAKGGDTAEYRSVLQGLQPVGEQSDLEGSKLGAIECTK